MNSPAHIIATLPWYEKALAAVAPETANRRLYARVQREMFAYQGARADRMYAPKTNAVPSESYQTARDRVVMMFEALDLVENFAPAKAVISKFSTFLSPNEYAPATGNRNYDALVAEYFHDWCKHCDIKGQHSFRMLVQLLAGMRPVYGDCGLALRRTSEGLKVEAIAGDRIGNPSEASGMYPRYFSGIIVNDVGAPEAFRIYRVDQAGQYLDPEDIPAASFAHYYDPFRADQYRGVTDFHAVLRNSRMLKEILDAEMAGVRFASNQAALVFTERGVANPRNLFTPGGAGVQPNGERPQQEQSDVGTIKYLYHGDKVETMPARPSSAFQGFVDELMAEIALGLGGYPAGVLWGTENYKGPSVRAEFAQADRVNQRHQGILEDKVLSRVSAAVILDAISRNELPPPPRMEGETPERAIIRATRGNFRFPPRLTIDVGRETQARLAELSMGATSPQEIAAEDGRDAYVRATEKADFAAFVQTLAQERGVPESSIFLPAGQQLPNTPAQAAAVGEKTGEDAATAQADSVSINRSEAESNEIAIDLATGCFIPTQSMAENALRAIGVREAKVAGERGMTAAGLQCAREIAARRPLSIETIKHLGAFFERNADSVGTDEWKDFGPAWQAWQGFGGNEARAWAKRILDSDYQLQKQATASRSQLDRSRDEVARFLSDIRPLPSVNYRIELHERLKSELPDRKN
jgi:capsid protein